MKVFVTGVGGQLGFDIVKELLKRNHIVTGSDIKDHINIPCDYIRLDITNKNAVTETILNISPDAVIHCAAWTAVDAAEYSDNYDIVMKINRDGTRYIAEACKIINCKMVYISTDYVFSGEGEKPWRADSKEFVPLNVYGRSKLEGEYAVSELLNNYFIVRTSWVFGNNGNNFVKTMLNVGKKYDTVRVVSDQIGTPTYTLDLAKLLVDIAESNSYGYYHASNEGGYISWYDFTKEIFRQTEYTTKVIPVTTKEYGISKAKRPFNSRLDKSKLVSKGFDLLPDWKDALERYLKENRELWDK